jgi:hypothetical protein
MSANCNAHVTTNKALQLALFFCVLVCSVHLPIIDNLIHKFYPSISESLSPKGVSGSRMAVLQYEPCKEVVGTTINCAGWHHSGCG